MKSFFISLLFFGLHIHSFLFAQDYGYRYQWEGIATEAVSFKANVPVTEHPMTSTFPYTDQELCHEGNGSSSTGGPYSLDLCQRRFGTCAINGDPDQWGYNSNLNLYHCGRVDGSSFALNNQTLSGRHAYGAILRNTSVTNTTCANCNLHEVFMQSTDLTDSTFFQTNFYNSEMASVVARRTNFVRSDFRVRSGVDTWSFVNLMNPVLTFGGSDFSDATFDYAKIKAQFSGANLQRASFWGVGHYWKDDLNNTLTARFSDLSDTNFDGSIFNTIELKASLIHRASFQTRITNSLYLTGTPTNSGLGQYWTEGNDVNLSGLTAAFVFINYAKLPRLQMVAGKVTNSFSIRRTFAQDWFIWSGTFQTLTIQDSTVTNLHMLGGKITHQGKITRVDLRNSRFDGTDLTKVQFCSVDLRGVAFPKANLVGTKYDSKTLLPFSESEATAQGMIKTDSGCN